MKHHSTLLFKEKNYFFMLLGFAIIALGFILMSGGKSTYEAFDPSIFNATRTKIAPMICFIGFMSIIVAIIRKPKDIDEKKD